MALTVAAFRITTATYTVANTSSYGLYYVDTSVSNTPISITLPTTVGNGGNSVSFISVTSVAAGDTTSNIVTISTANSTQSVNFTGLTQTILPKNGYVKLFAQDNGATGLWLTPAQNPVIPGTYGDGSDGTVTASTSTLTSDMYYENLIVPNGVSLSTGNFRVCVRGILTLQGTGNINNDGASGGNGASGAGGSGGASVAAQYFASTGGGGAGGTNSAVGTNAPTTGTTQSVGGSGAAGGATVAPAVAHVGGTGGTTVAVTAANGGIKVIKQIVNAIGGFLPTGIRFNAANGGGGGAGGATTSGGGGGGAGAGILLLCARNIVITGTGSRISANGGNGGNGGGTVGSGGGGGGGGAVIIVTQTQNLTANYAGILTVSANGGSAGTGTGAGSQSGTAGSAGTTAVVISN